MLISVTCPLSGCWLLPPVWSPVWSSPCTPPPASPAPAPTSGYGHCTQQVERMTIQRVAMRDTIICTTRDKQCTVNPDPSFFLTLVRACAAKGYCSRSVHTFSLEPYAWLLYLPNVDMWVCATGARHSNSLERRCPRTAHLQRGLKLYTAIILGVH